eukprot:gb/GFBE01007499.1/.p1 GENE.gb/GFBE01007499.1/~~gb/GFBE01007499.1/.p1  ORF type:complete len:103 (+),score=30.36 gb/GFBE01007499.1/:1-309(+)
MSVAKEFVVEALQGLQAWAADPANAGAMGECKAMVDADGSEGKVESKMGILKRMVATRCAEKPDSRLAAFQEDIGPLWNALQEHREDPEVDKLYEQVKSIMS